MMQITIKQLHQLLECDAQNGILIWKARPRGLFQTDRAYSMWNSRYAGCEALGRRSKGGYKRGSIFDRDMKAHRVIWAMHYGKWPAGDIDHINRDRGDNRIKNLRDVSHHENCKNQSVRSNNSSGAVGVYWYKRDQVWVAYININGKMKHLGRFRCFDAAVRARRSADKRYGFHPNHGRNP